MPAAERKQPLGDIPGAPVVVPAATKKARVSMSSLLLKLSNNDYETIIRGKVNEDGIQVFSVYDFITVSCGYKDSGATARKEFVRLIREGSEHAEEVVESCRYLKFNGKGQRETPCMTIRGLQRLLMILGGKVASEFRKIFEWTFTRVMAGDQSLIEVINANAASDAPLHRAYRAALATPIRKSSSLSMPRTCYIYATKSLAFPGLIKIGRTQDMRNRLTQLNTSCKPAPHSVVAVAPTLDSKRDEMMAHMFFSRKRCEGEFFRVDEAEISSYFQTHIKAQYDIEFQQKAAQLMKNV